jgi:hypothetical protein
MTRRGEVDIIEDVVTLHDVWVSVRAPGNATRVFLAPEGTEIPFEVREGRVEFTIPAICGHQMVVVDRD